MLLRRYLIHDEINYTMVRPLNVYGWMESGKTTLSLKIATKIEELVSGKHGFVCILGRRQSDVINYIENNRDIVRGHSYIVMIYDDAGRYYLSREAMTRERKEEIKDFLEIRHIFENMGVGKAVIVPIFNIQYYNLLEKTMRNTPASIWKSMVLVDASDRRELFRTLGSTFYWTLKVLTYAIYLSNYKLTRSAFPRRAFYDRVYYWLVDYFVERGAMEVEDGVLLRRDFAKRFGVANILGTPFLVDFGPEVRKPSNLVELKDVTPITSSEKDQVLYYTVLLAKKLGLSFSKYRETMRELGLSFTDSEASRIWQST